jgi:hypothetical protein
MNQATPSYPWYGAVTGDALEQGDLFLACPVFLPPESLAHGLPDSATFRWEERDLIVLSQSCDLVKGREKLTDVLLCSVWQRSELTEGYLATNKGMEEARRGNLPGFHVLAACDVPGLKREVSVVDFRRVYSLPLGFLRTRAHAMGTRIRLLPPYREHLSQAFARFFMRVGLPVDVPPFK